MPWEGRERDALDGFERPAVTTHAGTDGPQISTTDLKLRLFGGAQQPLRLVWQEPRTDQVFQSDRTTSAYLSERRTGLVRHCLERDPREHYFGLGDKTGPLNLHGRRLRCLGQDSIGYDPASGDPLYKHWPFVITRPACTTTPCRHAPLIWGASTTTTTGCFARWRSTTATWTIT
jgi:alpha-glucosidase